MRGFAVIYTMLNRRNLLLFICFIRCKIIVSKAISNIS